MVMMVSGHITKDGFVYPREMCSLMVKAKGRVGIGRSSWKGLSTGHHDGALGKGWNCWS